MSLKRLERLREIEEAKVREEADRLDSLRRSWESELICKRSYQESLVREKIAAEERASRHHREEDYHRSEIAAARDEALTKKEEMRRQAEAEHDLFIKLDSARREKELQARRCSAQMRANEQASNRDTLSEARIGKLEELRANRIKSAEFARKSKEALKALAIKSTAPKMF